MIQPSNLIVNTSRILLLAAALAFPFSGAWSDTRVAAPTTVDDKTGVNTGTNPVDVATAVPTSVPVEGTPTAVSDYDVSKLSPTSSPGDRFSVITPTPQ